MATIRLQHWFRSAAIGAGILVVCFLLWFFIPRPATPLEFNPENLSALEADMWKAYYEKDYPQLTLLLWRGVREEFGGSPWTGARIAYHAASAASLFQRSKSRAEAEAALPDLQRYYSLIRSASGADFDPAAAAREELEWWQLRRELASNETIARSLAKLYAITYDVPEAKLLPAARLRVEAMAYRDARRQTGLNPDEWETLRVKLEASYGNLKKSLAE